METVAAAAGKKSGSRSERRDEIGARRCPAAVVADLEDVDARLYAQLREDFLLGRDAGVPGQQHPSSFRANREAPPIRC